MATTISIPGVYQDVQEVTVSNEDVIELNFLDPPAGNILRIQNVTGSLGVSISAPTIKAVITLIGGSDGGLLALVPGSEAVLVPPAHGSKLSISLNNSVSFYIDSRPIIQIFLESSANAIALFTITGELIPKI